MTKFIERVGAILEKPSRFQTPSYIPTLISNVNSNAKLQWSSEISRDDKSSEISLQREYKRRNVCDECITTSDMGERGRDPCRIIEKNCNKGGFNNKEGNGYRNSINISKNENIGNELYQEEILKRQKNRIKQTNNTGQNICHVNDSQDEQEESENLSYIKNLSRNNPSKKKRPKKIKKDNSDELTKKDRRKKNEKKDNKKAKKNPVLGCSNSDVKADDWANINEKAYADTYMDEQRIEKLSTFCTKRIPEDIPEWDEYKLSSSWYYLAVKRAFCEFFGSHKVCVCTNRCSKALIPLKSLPASTERQNIYEDERMRRMSGKKR